MSLSPEEIAALRPWERYQYFMGQHANPAPTSSVVGAAPQMGAPAAPGANPLSSVLLGAKLAGLGGGGAAATTGAGLGASGVASTMSGAATAFGAPAAAPTAAAPLLGIGALPAAAIAGGIGFGIKGIKDLLSDKKTKGWEGWGGRLTLGAATGGLSEVARMAGLFGHKSTRQYARENTDKLMGLQPDNKTWQDYVTGMREQYNSAPTDPSKPFAGKYGSFDEYKKAGLEAADLTGVYGNLDAYGPAYAGLSFDQKKALTQSNIDAGNYYSSKGDVKIADKAKAQEIWDSFQKGLAAPAASTRKDSPGFKDGKRINYGSR